MFENVGYMKDGFKNMNAISLFANVGIAETYIQNHNIDVVVANELLERWFILSAEEFLKNGLNYPVPRVTEYFPPEVEKFYLKDFSDEELMKLSRDRLLALNLEEMQTIKGYYSRKDFIELRKKFGLDEAITDVELESLAQTWSEHCIHKKLYA